MRTRMQADRLIQAVLQNLDTWIEDGTAGIDGENPRLGLMTLTRNMMMARVSLKRLAGDPDAEENGSLMDRR
jgi:hypothetical protein